MQHRFPIDSYTVSLTFVRFMYTAVTQQNGRRFDVIVETRPMERGVAKLILKDNFTKYAMARGIAPAESRRLP